MQFKATLALCAAVLAAVTEGRIAFTTLPSSVKAGSPVKLSWEGADGTPITITLKRGPSDNLATVALITGDASGNSYTWTPSTSLQDGSDYALQITQSITDINYTGLFTVTGGSGSSSSSSSSSSSASASSAAAASASGVPYHSANATVTAAPSGTAPASAGVTGGTASGNTTFSSATLSSSSDSASSSAAATTTRSGSGSGSSASSSSTAAPTNAAVNIASNFGLLLAGVAAVVYLG